MPEVMAKAAGFRKQSDGCSNFEHGYAEKFLEENPSVKEHLKLCAHCWDEVQRVIGNKDYIQTSDIDDSIDPETYKKHKGKFVEKMLTRKKPKAQD